MLECWRIILAVTGQFLWFHQHEGHFQADDGCQAFQTTGRNDSAVTRQSRFLHECCGPEYDHHHAKSELEIRLLSSRSQISIARKITALLYTSLILPVSPSLSADPHRATRASNPLHSGWCRAMQGRASLPPQNVLKSSSIVRSCTGPTATTDSALDSRQAVITQCWDRGEIARECRLR